MHIDPIGNIVCIQGGMAFLSGGSMRVSQRICMAAQYSENHQDLNIRLTLMTFVVAAQSQ